MMPYSSCSDERLLHQILVNQPCNKNDLVGVSCFICIAYDMPLPRTLIPAAASTWCHGGAQCVFIFWSDVFCGSSYQLLYYDRVIISKLLAQVKGYIILETDTYRHEKMASKVYAGEIWFGTEPFQWGENCHVWHTYFPWGEGELDEGLKDSHSNPHD